MGFGSGVTAIGKLTRLLLGYAGEGGTRKIRIDVSEWLEQFPGAMIVIQMVRPVDRYKYFAAYTKIDNVLNWIIDPGEIVYSGKGLAQITLYNPDTKQEYKSRVVETIVAESLQEFNELEIEENDPAIKWVNQVIEAAQRAEEAIEKMPYIGMNGNWMIWDPLTGQFDDSGFTAIGDSGLNYGPANAGKLLYISADGSIQPLTLGTGLKLENGVLNVIGGTDGSGGGDTSQLFYTADGSAFQTLDDALFYVAGG